ncbi:MAG TPA: hypothetical protein VK491_07830, partial [Gemmatimonadaceae bacterium]|nr:hypothetical protein [Gemmatimonadaceae bacterium]
MRPLFVFHSREKLTACEDFHKHFSTRFRTEAEDLKGSQPQELRELKPVTSVLTVRLQIDMLGISLFVRWPARQLSISEQAKVLMDNRIILPLLCAASAVAFVAAPSSHNEKPIAVKHVAAEMAAPIVTTFDITRP